MSRWYTVSCSDCGCDINVHEDWSNPPKICKSCKENRQAQWYERSCEDCGTTLRIHRDWDNPPKICKSCKDRRQAQWYEQRCGDCGTTMKIHREWDNPPKVCKSCKKRRDDKWYEKACSNCGRAMRVCSDWDHPPTVCASCKENHAPITEVCAHCGRGFIIPTGTQIKCKQQGWDLPKRCEDCRELFRHKPFRTVREELLFGRVVFRTYNSQGQFISESEDKKGILGDEYREHHSHKGKYTGQTREKGTYRETRDKDGQVKSTSRERWNPLAGDYTESTGGSSQTKHYTRTETPIFGKKYRKTE